VTVEGSDDEFVKVRFGIQQDENSWPPVTSEGLWAVPLGDGRYRIDNTPWFVRQLATGDIVIAQADDGGELWATERAAWSGHLTLRVIPPSKGPLGGDRQAVLDAFEALGVTGEGVAQYGIVALDVAPDADLHAVKALLLAGAADGRWDYEEGCVTEEWMDLEVRLPKRRPRRSRATQPLAPPGTTVEAGDPDRLTGIAQTYVERVAATEIEHPGWLAAWSALREAVLRHGGHDVVPPDRPDPLIDMITEQGVPVTAEEVVQRAGERSECHANVVRLWRQGEATAIGTGYALSDDGLWREHSWAWDADGRLLETSVSRVRYFGVRLDGPEADWFASWIVPDI